VAVHPQVPGRRVGFQHIGEVNVADEVRFGRGVIIGSDREAGVAGGGDELLNISRSGVRSDGDQSFQWQSDNLGLGFLESQRSG
jgi:hypothetical protein